jgi:hypothetical protein
LLCVVIESHAAVLYFREGKRPKALVSEMIGGLFCYNHKGEVLISRVYRYIVIPNNRIQPFFSGSIGDTCATVIKP